MSFKASLSLTHQRHLAKLSPLFGIILIRVLDGVQQNLSLTATVIQKLTNPVDDVLGERNAVLEPMRYEHEKVHQQQLQCTCGGD